MKPMPRLAAVEKPGTSVAFGSVLKSMPGPSSVMATWRQPSLANTWYVAALSVLESVVEGLAHRAEQVGAAHLPGIPELGGGDDQPACLGQLRRRADWDGVAEWLTEFARKGLLGEEDELAAGHRVEHVHVGPADVLFLPPKRLLRLADLGDVHRRERPEVASCRVGREQLVCILGLHAQLAASGLPGGDRAGDEVEVRLQALVPLIAPAHPSADHLLTLRVRPRRLRRVQVDDHEVVDVAFGVAQDAEGDEAFGRVVEEVPVPLLALLELLVFLLSP